MAKDHLVSSSSVRKLKTLIEGVNPESFETRDAWRGKRLEIIDTFGKAFDVQHSKYRSSDRDHLIKHLKEKDAAIYRHLKNIAYHNQLAQTPVFVASKDKDVPLEIRLAIYEHAAGQPRFLTMYNLRWDTYQEGKVLGTTAHERYNMPPAIQRTCKMFREEGLENFYKDLELYVNLLDRDCAYKRFKKYFGIVGPRYAALIRRVRFRVGGTTWRPDNGHGIGITLYESSGRTICRTSTYVVLRDEPTKQAMYKCMELFRALERGKATLEKAVLHFIQHAPPIFFPPINNEHWSAADEQKYGLKWEAVSCKAGEVRITVPHLFHGSTAGKIDLRVTIFLWYVGVIKVSFTSSKSDAVTMNLQGAGYHTLIMDVLSIPTIQQVIGG
ncbi:hypothetical protein H2203_000326 [Taxawa tesnikishii (nom. ined.)]|nr:hypothetical protein H2203_000326 [Dothideales sp. JES 119]